MTETPNSDALVDPVVVGVIEDVREADESQTYFDPDPKAHRDFGYPISDAQGQLLYVLARAIGATRVVEFATSIGISTLYLAAAVRDNGGGVVVGSEIVHEKVERARNNIARAGLTDFTEVREGNGLVTLQDVDGPIDLVLLDGWPVKERPSIDRRVLELLVPRMRPGALLFDDNGESDVIEFLREPNSGFRSVGVPLDRGSMEIAVKL